MTDDSVRRHALSTVHSILQEELKDERDGGQVERLAAFFGVPSRGLGLARASDPESSKLAAEELVASGKHAKQKRFVLIMLRAHDGATARELAKDAATAGGGDINALVHIVGRRLPDLEKDGLVRRGAQRTCSVGRRQALTWWINKNEEP